MYRAVVWWTSIRTEAAVKPATLPLRLLETADALAAQGDPEQAALVAVAAVDAVPVVGVPEVPRLDELRRLGVAAAAGDDSEAAARVLHLAHELVADVYASAEADGAGLRRDAEPGSEDGAGRDGNRPPADCPADLPADDVATAKPDR